MTVAVFTLRERPDYAEQIEALSREAWPEFLLHADAHNWQDLFDVFPEYQLLLCGPDGELLAVGHTVPLPWQQTPVDLPETIYAIIARAAEARAAGTPPNTLAALAALVSHAQRGRGLSYEVIRQMMALAARAGCSDLIAPVRPTWKSRYPLVPMEQYIQWTRPDGEAFDPWLRVHLRLGGQVLQVAGCTLKVEASVAEWEAWTGLPLPGSGAHVVPGALQPVAIDREKNVGLYEDPNVWVRHAINLPVPRSQSQ